MQFKRGRLPARHTMRTMRGALALAKALAPLGTPPAVSSDYISAVTKAVATLSTPPAGGPWGMFLNGSEAGSPVPDGVGNCTCADSAHQVMLHTANAGSIIVPTDDDVLAMYEAVGGYQLGQPQTDQGADETTVCDYLMSTGLAAQKSAGTGMIDPANMDHLRWCTQMFGCARLGIMVDQAMEDAFSSGQPWETAADPNDPTAGGHDVPVVGYDADGVTVITWGNVQRVTWTLMADRAFLQEAHAEVWSDFCTAGGTAPSGFDLSQLLAELPAVEAA